MSFGAASPGEHMPGPRLSHVLERNIQALIERREAEEQGESAENKIARAITRFTGSMHSVYLHLVVFGLWVVVNLGWIPFIQPFDPTLVVLASFASVEAIFLSTFVLITQNRMAAMADKRADLDLQISLLAEHEVTRLVTLVSAIAERLDIQEAQDPELPELERDVEPERVLDEMEKSEEAIAATKDQR